MNNIFLIKMRMAGIEPATFRLKVERSTTELRDQNDEVFYGIFSY